MIFTFFVFFSKYFIVNKKGRKVVDLDVLTSEYHETMLAALAFLPKISEMSKGRLPSLRFS